MHKAPQPVRLRRCYVDRLFVLLVGVHAQVGVDEAVNVAVHDGLNVAVFIASAVVLGQRVRHEHVRAPLALVQEDLREIIPSVTLDAGNSFCCEEAITGLCNATFTLSADIPTKGITMAP